VSFIKNSVYLRVHPAPLRYTYLRGARERTSKQD
jgi:hypothetical protein